MPEPEDRQRQRARHAAEVEESQRELRKSIANTEMLLDQSDAMLKRHRRECEDTDLQK